MQLSDRVCRIMLETKRYDELENRKDVDKIRRKKGWIIRFGKYGSADVFVKICMILL